MLALCAWAPQEAGGFLDQVLSEPRDWAEENIYLMLVEKPLARLDAYLLGPWNGLSRDIELSEIFFPETRIPPLAPRDVEVEALGHGLANERWTEFGDALPQEAWAASVAEFWGAIERVRWVKLKPMNVSLGPKGAAALIEVALNYETADGGLRHVTGHWQSDWRINYEGEWRCTSLAPTGPWNTLASEYPHFVDTTESAFAGTALDPLLPTALEGSLRGVALGDLDGDGDLDLVTTLPVRLLYNRGDGTFEDHTRARLPSLPGGASHGVLVADFDRNGAADVLLATTTHPLVLLLQSEGAFQVHPIGSSDFGESAILEAASREDAVHESGEERVASSLSAHDVDGDGWLDVFLATTGHFPLPGPDDPTSALNAGSNRMFRGLPGARFEDVTEAWGLAAEATRWSTVGVFGDADSDGDADLFVANDFGPNVLYRRADDRVWFEPEVEPVARSGFSGSATWADLDGDLDNDLFVSGWWSAGPGRMLNDATRPDEGELEADLDALRVRMAKGNVLLTQHDGDLEAVSGGLGTYRADWSFGTAAFDYDGDGDLDLHAVNGYWSQGTDDGRDL